MSYEPSPESTQGVPCLDPDILIAADEVRKAIRLTPLFGLSLTQINTYLYAVADVQLYGELIEASYVNPGVTSGGSLYTFRWRVDTFDDITLVLLIAAEGRAKVAATGGVVNKEQTIELLHALAKRMHASHLIDD